jgi:hypothetical protein
MSPVVQMKAFLKRESQSCLSLVRFCFFIKLIYNKERICRKRKQEKICQVHEYAKEKENVCV